MNFLINQPVRISTNVWLLILFFEDAEFDDNELITGDGSKPALSILINLISDD